MSTSLAASSLCTAASLSSVRARGSGNRRALVAAPARSAARVSTVTRAVQSVTEAEFEAEVLKVSHSLPFFDTRPVHIRFPHQRFAPHEDCCAPLAARC
jgi:hypothetical protein